VELIGIVRVSTKEQASDEKTGVKAQTNALNALAASEGFQIDIVPLIDVSGSDVALTPEWASVRVRIQSPDVQIAVHRIDRLVRPDEFDLTVFRDLQSSGTLIYTPTRTWDLSVAEDVAMLQVLGAFGGLERMIFKARSLSGKETKRAEGLWVQGDQCLPYGVAYNRETHRFSYTDDSQDVAEAFRLLVEEGLSVSAIHRRLGKHSRTRIRGWLSNSIYRGRLVFDERRGREKYQSKDGRQPERRKVKRSPSETISIPARGLEKPLISSEVWHTAQARLRAVNKHMRKMRAEAAPQSYYSALLYSGLEVPEGQPMSNGLRMLDLDAPLRHVIYSNGLRQYAETDSRVARYCCRCTHSAPGGPPEKCGLPWYRATELNEALDTLFERLCKETWFKRALLAAATPGKDNTAERERVEELLSKLTRKKDRLIDLHIDGKITRAEFDKRQHAITEERERLERIQERLSRARRPNRKALRAYLAGLQFKASWDYERKREWLVKNIVHIIIGTNGVESVLLRLPVAVGRGLGAFNLTSSFSWEELVGYDISDRKARVEAKGVSFTTSVAKRLGISPAKLNYHIRHGRIQRPAGRHGNRYLWTEREILEAEEVLSRLV